MEGCSQAVSLRGTSAVVGDNGCDGATDPGPDTPKTTVDAAILGFRNTHPAWDDDPESDLRILRDRHVIRLARRLHCDRFVAAARCKLWWMTPTWGAGGDALVNSSSSTEAGIPAETQFVLFELNGGSAHVAAVPIISDGFRCTLSGHVNDCRNTDDDDDDETDGTPHGTPGDGTPGDGTKRCVLALVAESNCERETCDGVDAALVLACSDSPFRAVEAAMAVASEAMNGTFRLRTQKVAPPVVDVFGWCTWDAFYHAVTPAGVEAGVAALADGGIPPRFVIIDDGWQSVAPDPQFKKRVDHISDHPRTKPDFIDKPHVTEVVEFGRGDAGGGALAWAGGALASGLEYAYWNALHSVAYNSLTWNVAKFLVDWVFSPVIRGAFSTMSCFNHRVSAIHANVKFQDEAGRASDDSPSVKRVKGRGTKRKSPTADGGMVVGGEDGFGRVISRIKALGVQSVYCWHALFGYWGGLHPFERGVSRFRPKVVLPRHTPGLLSVEPSQAWDPISVGGVGTADPEKLAEFYEELHLYLADAGVDGVKVDGQAMVGGLGRGLGGGPNLARHLHAALEKSVKRHFPTNGLINCMCHSTENIFNFGDSALARVSDDFYPTNNASHTVHLANVAYISTFMGEVVVPDWDMFHSLGDAGPLHAAARAVGGCPVYVSDAPGKHDFNLLRQLVFPSGKVLRAKLPGRPTRDCLYADTCRDGVSSLKVWNRNDIGGVVGCFNIQGAAWSRRKGIFVFQHSDAGDVPSVVASVRPEDVEGMVTGTADGSNEEFVIQAHRTRSLSLLKPGQRMPDLLLGPKEWEVYTVCKVLVAGAVKWAPVALDQMLNGGGALESCSLTLAHGVKEGAAKGKGGKGGGRAGVVGETTLYGCGALVCYSSVEPIEVEVDGARVRAKWRASDGNLIVPLGPREGTHAVVVRF